MDDHDVHQGEMDELTPEELEYLLEHPDELDTHPVAVVFADLRSALQSVKAPAPGVALAEFLAVSASTSDDASPSPVDNEVKRVAAVGSFRRHSSSPRSIRSKRKAAKSFAAIAATTGGKILLSTTAAAAAFGAAQATGIIDITPDEPAEMAVTAEGSTSQNSTAAVNQFRVEANAAGSLGVFVEDGEIRLADISSAAGWTGRLKADFDTEVLVAFENDADSDRQINVLLTLTEADPKRLDEGAVPSFVTVQVSDNGAVSTSWFGTDGSVLTAVDVLAGLTADSDVTVGVDLGGKNPSGDATELDVQAGVSIDDGAGVQAGVEVDTGVDLGADSDRGVRVGADTSVEFDVDGDVRIDADTTTGVQVNGNTGLGVDADTDLGLDTGLDLDADIDIDTGLGVDTELDIEADVDLDLDTGLGTDLGLDTDLDLDADIDLGTGLDTGLDTGLGVETGLGIDLNTDADGGIELDLDVDLDVDDGLGLGLGLGSLFGD